MNNDSDDPQTPNPTESERIELGDRFTVARKFFEQIIAWIRARLDEIEGDRIYTAKRLAGLEYWRQLTPSEQRLAGRCIAHGVCKGLLPLVFVKGEHEFPLRYRMK
jgi:hypothetical protein